MVSNNQLHKLLILSQHSEIYRRLLEEQNLPGLSIVNTVEPDEELREYCECDIVFGEPALIRRIINRLPKVIWVQSSWAGVEPLLGLNTKPNYTLTNVRNVYGPLMSEYVFGYILMIERKIFSRFLFQQAKQWDVSLNGTLRGKLIGLCGVGSIGTHLAQTAKHFGMRVYGFTRKSESSQYIDKYFHKDDWGEFARDLDYIVCTLPGTELTKDFINHDAITRLPDKAWLINVGRGSTIDEFALVQALKNRTINGAVLDVFKEEPLPIDHPLWSAPNTFITFHTAAQNNPPDIASIFIENYLRLIHGESLKYQVDQNLGY